MVHLPYPAGIFEDEAESLLDAGKLQALSAGGEWFDVTRVGATERDRQNKRHIAIRCKAERLGNFMLRGAPRHYKGLSLGPLKAVGYQWSHQLRRKPEDA